MRAFLWHDASNTPIDRHGMQVYYFYRHQSDGYVFISREKHTEHILEFFWIDSVRSDVVSQNEEWQQKFSNLQMYPLMSFICEILRISNILVHLIRLKNTTCLFLESS